MSQYQKSITPGAVSVAFPEFERAPTSQLVSDALLIRHVLAALRGDCAFGFTLERRLRAALAVLRDRQ
jgi:hypothetical protein